MMRIVKSKSSSSLAMPEVATLLALLSVQCLRKESFLEIIQRLCFGLWNLSARATTIEIIKSALS